ncbi:MAG TPA: ABC transporter ATP-binding protein, partial [Archaeoglobus sp.]|nr:ABC transporter ATP-binding protein [Archaeoglobus sp.]
MSVILETKEVTKNFSGFIAVNKVSLSFERRSITAL